MTVVVVKSVGRMDQKGKLAQLDIREATPNKEKAVKRTNKAFFKSQNFSGKGTKSGAIGIMLHRVLSILRTTPKEAPTMLLKSPSCAPPVPKSVEQ